MKKKMRIGGAIVLTTTLFTIYELILQYFMIPVWKPFLGFAVLLGLLTAAGYYVPRLIPDSCRKIVDKVKELHNRAEESFYSLFSERGFFFQLWFLLSLVFVPAWIALFPGTFGYDAPIQVASYFGNAGIELTAHHPLAHTFLMGVFFSLGENLFHSYNIGFALYIALQGLIVTGSIAYSLAACRRHRVPLILIVIGAIWSAINPFIWVLTFNSTKDILFGAFLLCFSVELWDFLECPMAGRGNYIRLTAFGILMCLFRNQGIYIALGILLVCLILRARKKGLCICLLIVCLVAQGFFSISSGVLKIPEGDKKEMLSVPMQQMARVCSAYLAGDGEGVDITQEQYEIVTEIIPQEGIQAYMASGADNVKTYFQTDVFFGNFGKYFSNYIAIGMQNTGGYRDAWLDLIRPFWDMTGYETKDLAFQYTFPQLNQWGISRNNQNAFAENFYSYLYRVVVIEEGKLFTRPETCLWFLAALPGLAIARKKKNLFLGMVPLALYLCTTLLGPVALLRYLFPLTIATPMLLGMLFQGAAPEHYNKEVD